MKVVIVGQMLNANHRDKISGGIQTVERLHARILLEQKMQVVFIGPADSELFNDDPQFKLLKLSTKSEEGYEKLVRAEKSRLSKARTAELKDLIYEENPDLIINHSFSSSQVRLMAECSALWPVLNFIHNTPDTAMDIGIIAKAKCYLELVKNGSQLICVSEYQRDLWRKALKKRIINGESFSFLTAEDVDRIYDKFCYPVYVNENEVVDPDGSFIVITRPDPIKNLHKLLELSVKCDSYPLHIFMACPGKITDNEYYNEKLAPPAAQLMSTNLPKYIDFTVNLNKARPELLGALSVASGCFIPCAVESAPVALLEAASYGVRSIVFAKEREGVADHAALRLLSAEHVELINISQPTEEVIKSLQKAIKKLEADPGDRQKLRDYTLKRHSFKQRIEDLMEIVLSVSSTYMNKQSKKRLWL